MNKQHIAFPSIEQFRSVIKHIKYNCSYHGVPLPTLTFTGTVKLHGTNHGICRAPSGEIYTQSRERITTFESDNAGSHVWTIQNAGLFQQVFDRICFHYKVGIRDTIQIFGEWCGGNIQKGVGLNFIPKQFIVFAIRVSENAESTVFFSHLDVYDVCDGIIPTIYDFPTFTLDIDFARPEVAQSALIAKTAEVEQDCPVSRQILGKDFPHPLVGEGIVWTTVYNSNTLRFKVKGEKHSSSKVKTLAPVDVEKIESIREFVASVVTTSRLEQGLEHVTAREPKYTGDFLKWVMSDIYKEESDTMIANGFTSKECSSPLATAIKQWFLQ
jgi:hypothetical protein